MQSEESTPIIRSILSAPFGENSYLIAIPLRKDAIVVDPGLEPAKITAELAALGVTPIAILNTHGHADHIAGNGELKRRFPDAPLVIGHLDADKLTDPVGNLSAGFGMPMVSPPADQTVREGEVLDLAGIRWTVRETPGHCRGHVVFIALELEPVIVLGGDVLFAGGVGRTDFPDGDSRALVTSISEKLFPLPDSTVVLPGHGPATTIGREKRTNPFVGEGALEIVDM